MKSIGEVYSEALARRVGNCGFGLLVAAMAIVGPTSLAQTAPQGVPLQFVETFESGTVGSLVVSGNPAEPTRESARSGQWALKSHLNRNSSDNRIRTESRIPGTQTIGDEHWLGFSIRPSADWRPDNIAEAVVFQAHDSVYPSNKNPIFALRAMPNGQWRLEGKYIEVANGSKSDQRSAFQQDIGAIEAGKWADFVIHYRWAYAHNAGGFTRVWKDGVLVLDYSGPNCYNDLTGPFWKFGVYAALWDPKWNYDHSMSQWTFYHDEIRLAGAGGDFRSVSPVGATRAEASPASPILKVQ